MRSFNIFDATFPIYTITDNHKKIWEDMNVLYIDTISGTYMLDNRNVAGETLGKRRLKLKNTENLYVPRKVCYNFEQVLHCKNKCFIDNTGTVFKYIKTTFVPLKYHKVDYIERLEEGCIVHLKDVYYPQKFNCRKAHSIEYVGLLHTKMGLILYENTDIKKKDTRRKI